MPLAKSKRCEFGRYSVPSFRNLVQSATVRDSLILPFVRPRARRDALRETATRVQYEVKFAAVRMHTPKWARLGSEIKIKSHKWAEFGEALLR